MRVVVVGSGVAGLVAAREASRRHDVVLVTKASLEQSNTYYAQGGVAAALFPDDSVASHVADTLVAGAGLSDPDAVAILCSEGPDRVRDLIALGVAFDRTASGELARGHEAAHSHQRVVHAGGDATGRAIEVGLVAAVRASAVEIHENAFVTDLVVRDGAVVGVRLGDREIAADAVILASGGAGQLYAHTTNPAVTTGDGIAAAWRAGAELEDLEFYQFHPTSLAVPGNPLVSEAVRGEGAVLRALDGTRFMLDVHPDAELAPRDVVARGIAEQMARQGGAPVLLDATALGEEFLRERFPGITASLEAHGLSWREPFPVTPAAHYWMGGIRTDVDGRTSLPGLFAVGEVACTGVHGANRLASNSLLESLVFAHRAVAALDAGGAGLAAAAGGSGVAAVGETERLAPRDAADAAGTPPAPAADTPSSAHASEIQELHAEDHAFADVLAAAASRSPEFPTITRAELQLLMWRAAGLHRSGDGLREAAAVLATVGAAPGEDANLLDLARLVVDAALAREESRGAHFRDDFPHADPALARHSSSIREELAHV